MALAALTRTPTLLPVSPRFPLREGFLGQRSRGVWFLITHSLFLSLSRARAGGRSRRKERGKHGRAQHGDRLHAMLRTQTLGGAPAWVAVSMVCRGNKKGREVETSVAA
jgi:hypothetical protein